MFRPRPGTEAELKFTLEVVKKRSARLVLVPNLAAHHARETPHPSQVPQLLEVEMTVVSSAWMSVGRRERMSPAKGS